MKLADAVFVTSFYFKLLTSTNPPSVPNFRTSYFKLHTSPLRAGRLRQRRKDKPETGNLRPEKAKPDSKRLLQVSSFFTRPSGRGLRPRRLQEPRFARKGEG